MKLGLISDTHNHWDPGIADHFKGVDHILHAGDFGLPWILMELEEIAPVTAVRGNNDDFPQYKETEIIALDGLKILLNHEAVPDVLGERIRKRIAMEKPQVIVFGHTHACYNQRLLNTLFVNPGYAGRPGYHWKRTVAILHWENPDIRVEFIELA
jgi:putative phosphoesterase